MKLLLLIDEQARGAVTEARIIRALEKIKIDFSAATPVTWEFEYRNFDNLVWVNYDTEALGIEWSYIRAQTKRIWEYMGYNVDHVVFCVDPANWRNGKLAVGGWNLGNAINGYYGEIVQLTQNEDWLWKIFAMELAHAFDNLVWEELTINLSALSGLNFDYDIVHGENPNWGIYQPSAYTRTNFYTDFNYTKLASTFGVYIRAAYTVRQQRMVISLAERIIGLLRMLIQLKNKPKPVTMNEVMGLRGKHEHH